MCLTGFMRPFEGVRCCVVPRIRPSALFLWGTGLPFKLVASMLVRGNRYFCAVNTRPSPQKVGTLGVLICRSEVAEVAW